MHSKDLIKVWTAPDNSQLTPKQISIRLPLHVAAKIEALCEIFPKKTKTEIIGDLLATALDDVVEGFSNEPYPDEAEEASRTDFEGTWGDRGRYHALVEKHFKEIDAEDSKLGGGSSETANSQKGENLKVSDGPAVGGGPRKARYRLARSRSPKK